MKKIWKQYVCHKWVIWESYWNHIDIEKIWNKYWCCMGVTWYEKIWNQYECLMKVIWTCNIKVNNCICPITRYFIGTNYYFIYYSFIYPSLLILLILTSYIYSIFYKCLCVLVFFSDFHCIKAIFFFVKSEI